MNRRRRTILLAVLLLVIGGTSYVVYDVHYYMHTIVPDSYAVWWIADITIAHMEAHDGAWPKNWDDLRGDYENYVKNRGGPWSFEDLRSRVDIDWSADPLELARTAPTPNKPPFHVIWLRDGNRYYWGGHEPNQILLEYLADRRVAGSQPSSSSR